LLHETDGLVIGCPEYNGYITPLLLNTIDWSTRSSEGGADLSAFRDRPVLITSASPGAMGGARAMTQLRSFLGGIGCLVLPDNFAVGGAMSAFDETGAFIDDKLQQRADGIAQRFDEFARRNEQQG
jgi:chromate reductase